MAKIKKLYKKTGKDTKELVYPVTITQAIKDGETGQNLHDYMNDVKPKFKFDATQTDSQLGTVGTIMLSQDGGKTWNPISPEFLNNLRIQDYVATTSALPANKPVGTIYGVGPTYAAEDTAQTNPIYRLYVYNGTTWVDNGQFTSIAAGIVQETGNSETEVMSQKAIFNNYGTNMKEAKIDSSLVHNGNINNVSIGDTINFLSDDNYRNVYKVDIENVSLIKLDGLRAGSNRFIYAFTDENDIVVETSEKVTNANYYTYDNLPVPRIAKYLYYTADNNELSKNKCYILKNGLALKIDDKVNTIEIGQVFKKGYVLKKDLAIQETVDFIEEYSAARDIYRADVSNIKYIKLSNLRSEHTATNYLFAFTDVNDVIVGLSNKFYDNNYYNFDFVKIPKNAKYIYYTANPVSFGNSTPKCCSKYIENSIYEIIQDKFCYIDKNGSDALGNGTKESPFKTFAHAYSVSNIKKFKFGNGLFEFTLDGVINDIEIIGSEITTLHSSIFSNNNLHTKNENNIIIIHLDHDNYNGALEHITTKKTMSSIVNYSSKELYGRMKFSIEECVEDKDWYYDIDTNDVYIYSERDIEGILMFNFYTSIQAHNNSIFKNINFVGYGGNCLNFKTNCIAENCNFSYIGGAVLYDKVRVGNGVQIYVNENCYNILVTRCTFYKIFDVAMTVQMYGSEYNYICKNIKFNNNKTIECTQGFESALTSNSYFENIVVENNIFERCGANSKKEWDRYLNDNHAKIAAFLNYQLEEYKCPIFRFNTIIDCIAFCGFKYGFSDLLENITIYSNEIYVDENTPIYESVNYDLNPDTGVRIYPSSTANKELEQFNIKDTIIYKLNKY